MRAEQRSGTLMAAPYTVFLLVFAAYPILFALVLVFLQWDLVTTPQFAGVDNIRLLANDGRFWRAVMNTFVFLSIHLPLQIATALALALALNRPLVFRSFWRAAFFLPVVISGAVVAILWSNLYATDVGLINGLLVRLGLNPVPWLTDPNTAMPAIAAMVTWKNVGFYVIIYLAGLKGIPISLFEAATIDGAGPLRRLWNVTLPMLSPLIFYNVVMGLIASFQFFVQAMVMTKGGPNDLTLFYVLNLYRQAFEFHNMGYASALAWVLFLILLGLTIVIFRASKSLVYYEGLKT